MTMNWDDLPLLFPGFPAPEEWLPRLKAHAEVLAEQAPVVRTTSVSGDEMIGRHFAESLEILRIIREHEDEGLLVDVGPGGGFPGLVIAAVEPERQVALVEPLKKRGRLLEVAVERLGLEHVQVIALRGEEAGRTDLRETASVVTARAVAPLPELLEYCAPLARVGGLLALPKGRSAVEEVSGAAVALETLACEVLELAPMRPEVSATPHVVLLRKLGPTSSRYPRRPGMPRKQPLGK